MTMAVRRPYVPLWRKIPATHVSLCPHCRRPMPPDLIARSLPRIQRALFLIVAEAGEAGIATPDIMRQLYRDEPEEQAHKPNIISVLAGYANEKIRQHGIALRASRGRGAVWRLVDCPPEPIASPELPEPQQ